MKHEALIKTIANALAEVEGAPARMSDVRSLPVPVLAAAIVEATGKNEREAEALARSIARVPHTA